MAKSIDFAIRASLAKHIEFLSRIFKQPFARLPFALVVNPRLEDSVHDRVQPVQALQSRSRSLDVLAAHVVKVESSETPQSPGPAITD